MNSKISMAVLVCLDLAIFGQAQAASQVNPKTPTQTSISLSDVLKSYRTKASLNQFDSALEAKSIAQTEFDAQRSPGAWTLGLSAEKSIQKAGDNKVDLVVKRKIALGLDREAGGRRYSSEAKVASIAKQQEVRDQELEVAKLFSQLRQKQRVIVIDKEGLAILEPLEKRAKAAAQLGTLGGFFATRLKLTTEAVRSDLIRAENAYVLGSAALSAVSGLAIPSDATASRLLGLESGSNAVDSQVTEQTFLPSIAGRARQDALAAEATQLQSRWEIEAGLGMTRNLETNTNGILLELDIPLGVASAAMSEVKRLAAEQAVVKAEGDLALARGNDQLKILRTNVNLLTDAMKIEGSRISGLETLLKKAQEAFRAGQGDLSEVIETAKEWHEGKMKIADLSADLEEANLALIFFVKGGVP